VSTVRKKTDRQTNRHKTLVGGFNIQLFGVLLLRKGEEEKKGGQKVEIGVKREAKRRKGQKGKGKKKGRKTSSLIEIFSYATDKRAASSAVCFPSSLAAAAASAAAAHNVRTIAVVVASENNGADSSVARDSETQRKNIHSRAVHSFRDCNCVKLAASVD